MPQPGSLASLVENYPDAVKPAPPSVEANVDKWFGPDWKKYGSVDGTLYAAPLGANVKSFVWYSPKEFADKGWTVPTTWDEMMTLTKTIAATGIKPWCAGFESGGATGWPGTDWLEDVLLRTAGPEVYDQWVDHEIPFNDPQIVDALDHGRRHPEEPGYVNGGFGDPSTIATTAFGEAGNPILVRTAPSARCIADGRLLRAQLAEGHQRRRERRRVRVLPAADRPEQGQAGPGWWRVRRRVQRQPGEVGVPDLPVLARVGQRQGQGDPGRRLDQRQQGPGRSATSPARSTSSRCSC